MKKMMKLIAAIFTLSAGVVSGQAHASSVQQIPDFYRLRPATVKEVLPTVTELYSDVIVNSPTASPTPTPTPMPTPVPGPAPKLPQTSDFTLDWSTITAIGDKIIQIVQAGKPVVNVTRSAVSVVPGGVSNWTQLSGWRAPVTKVYSITAENELGMTIVDMRLKVSANYGGGIDGKGQYLANLVVVPSAVYVLWGFSADVFSEHQDPVNVGSSDNPVAGLGFDIRYKYSSALFAQEGTQSYFVSGDGQINEVQ